MRRRQLIQAAGIATATIGLAGCAGPGTRPDGTAEPADGDSDVSVTIVQRAPENPGPYENPGGTLTPQESDALTIDGLTFQRAGQKGLVVAGDATNTSDRAFGNVAVEVILYDENDAGDEVLDSLSAQTDYGRLDSGETWQWAATFREEPEFQVDYYAVHVRADYA